MSMQEGRRRRRRTGGATLEAVATAPCTLGAKKPRRKRSFARRAVVLAAILAVPALTFLAAPKSAFAVDSAPEIDPTSMAGALTLLVGGVLMLTDRARRA